MVGGMGLRQELFVEGLALFGNVRRRFGSERVDELAGLVDSEEIGHRASGLDRTKLPKCLQSLYFAAPQAPPSIQSVGTHRFSTLVGVFFLMNFFS